MIEFFMIGNLGSDAVVNKGKDDSPIINFSVCHSESWKKRNLEEKKYWVDCAFFTDNKELASMLIKGTQVYVKGTPDVKVHVKQNGDPIAVQYLRVSKVEILSKRKKEDSV